MRRPPPAGDSLDNCAASAGCQRAPRYCARSRRRPMHTRTRRAPLHGFRSGRSQRVQASARACEMVRPRRRARGRQKVGPRPAPKSTTRVSSRHVNNFNFVLQHFYVVARIFDALHKSSAMPVPLPETRAPAADTAHRLTLFLDGRWEVAESISAVEPPAEFPHFAPVPGLVNRAQPPFAGVDEFESCELNDSRISRGEL